MYTLKNILYSTVILAGVAGFCDTATFVAADELFSAHVTGNFIVFAYDIVNEAGANSWERLLTFPVFIIAVAMGGMLSKTLQPYILFLVEGLLLLGAGVMSVLVIQFYPQENNLVLLIVVLIIVLAMGFAKCIRENLPAGNLRPHDNNDRQCHTSIA
ncbi:MAG: YoaK family protein [Bacteroidota bacterium]